MGFPNIYHIAPAILYMNPGVNRDEYFSLLDKTHGSSWAWHFGEGSEKVPLTYYDPTQEDSLFHSLDGLASLLELGYSEEYNAFREKRFDANGLPIKPVFFYPDFPEKGRYTAFIHEKNIIGTERQITFFGAKKIKPGYIDSFRDATGETMKKALMHDMMGETMGNASILAFIKEIHSKKFAGLEIEHDGFGDKYPVYKYVASIVPFEQVKRKEVFDSKEDMLKNWPIQTSERMYAWDKERGGFMDFVDRLKDFEWYKKDGKYYLDDCLLDKISASSYRQLVFTAEAIKVGAWKPLSYAGYNWWGQFLDTYPDARKTFEIAGYFSQHSMSAKHEGIKNTEFLRRMILGGNHYTDFYSNNRDLDM